MRRILVYLVLVPLLCRFAPSQQAARVEVFGGYSLERISACGPSGADAFFVCTIEGARALSDNFNGWNASATVFAYRFLGITADFSGHYGTATTSLGFGDSASRYSFMFGPVVAARKQRIAPFAHVLFGRIENNFASNVVTGEALNYSSFTWAIGAGFDLTVTRHWAVRMGQFDYEHATVPQLSNSGSNISSPVNGFRFSAGVVFRP